MFLTITLTLLAMFLTIFFLYIKLTFTYLDKIGIQGVRPKSWIFGDLAKIGKRPIYEMIHDRYLEAKSTGKRMAGLYLFTTPVILIMNPSILRNMLIRDFDHFQDRGVFFDEKNDPLSAHLFSLQGSKWKKLRAKLTPTFTTGKMKKMYTIILTVASELERCVYDKCAYGPVTLEWKDILSRFTTDVIGSTAFGIECNSLQNPNAEFKRMSHKVFSVTSFRMILILFVSFFPNVAKILRLRITEDDVEEFFMKLVKSTIEYREENNIKRNDFVNLLLQLKNHGQLEDEDSETEQPVDTDRLTFNEIAAQCFVFFIAGYETSSTVMTFCLYELAKHPEIQEKLRNEINTALEQFDNNLTYNAQGSIPYLDDVINETLRMYPPLANLQRIVDKECTIDGIKLKKNQMIMIPLYSMQRDADFFENPLEFQPDRFAKGIIPFSFLPFGEGPRACIGKRFGFMQTRVGLITLLRKFRFTMSDQMPEQLKFSPTSTTMSPIDGMWLNVECL